MDVDKAIGALTIAVGLAGIAVVVSKRSDTAKVVTALLKGYTELVRGAVSPVTGK